MICQLKVNMGYGLPIKTEIGFVDTVSKWS